MSIQLSTAIRNARLNQVEVIAGASAKLQLRTGAPPSDCVAADSGSLLVEMVLPADWMADAASGTKAKAGTWSGTAVGAGVAGHFRIKDNAGTTTHVQGTVGMTGGSEDMIVDNTNIAVTQTVLVNTFVLTDGNP